ncbi:MAG: ABC transporter ATP-binding protein [Planctomycetes bacterium]|nr:ABC transporter ATP-binding protein [Planctomycetota bacterium]
MLRKLKPIWILAAGQRLRYGAAIAALVFASCFLYLPPLVPQVVIDGVLVPPEGGEQSVIVTEGLRLLGGREYVAENLWWPALIIVALTAIAGVFTYLRARWSAAASESIARSVRERVYDHLQHLPCTFFDRSQTGDLVQRATSDVETLRVFLSTQVVEIGRAVFMLAAPIPLMLAIDVRMTIASLVLIPFVTAFSLVYFRKVQAAFLKTDESEGRLTATVQENLTGIRVVRAFARQEYETEKFAERIEEYRDLDYRLYELHARFWSISDCLCFLQKALQLGVGIALLITGEIGVGALFFFITAVSMFIWPVRQMGRILNDLGKAMVALGRLQEILSEPEESEPAPASAPPEALKGAIVFDRVTFAHGSGSPVLENVSFKVAPGQTLALLGPSGSGKSTIVNLLLRLYDYEDGSIRLDDAELRTLDRAHVRGQAAVVMQEPFLYSKTLRENLTIGRPSAGEDDVLEAASIACVHDSILEFEQGYDTRVGERGVTLSGGQRQRVALARALLQEPAVLVLDDALSAVDAETETLILEALRSRHGRHTTIVIAHRLSTLMHADRILVLEHGRVVQSGTHEELREVDGLYRRLWSIQNELTVTP